MCNSLARCNLECKFKVNQQVAVLEAMRLLITVTLQLSIDDFLVILNRKRHSKSVLQYCFFPAFDGQQVIFLLHLSSTRQPRVEIFQIIFLLYRCLQAMNHPPSVSLFSFLIFLSDFHICIDHLQTSRAEHVRCNFFVRSMYSSIDSLKTVNVRIYNVPSRTYTFTTFPETLKRWRIHTEKTNSK